MRIILQATTGPKTGHKKSLRGTKSLEIGRSPLAHFVFDSDSEMSSRHFKIWTDGSACYLEDLGSANGTRVNGQPVKRGVIGDQDKIQAGSTQFVARVEGASAEVTQVPVKEVEASETESTAYTVETCSNGVLCYSGTSEDPISIVKRLAEVLRAAFIVDVNRLNAIGQEDFTRPAGAEPLFSWIPDEVREKVSPLVLHGLEQAETLLIDAWGQDAVVSIYAGQDEEPPLEHLRNYAGAFARPSVVRPQLTQTAADAAQSFLAEVQAVFVENQDAVSWLLFSLSDVGPLLQQIGLIQAQQNDSTPPSD